MVDRERAAALADTLEQANLWRRGRSGAEQPDPFEFGAAIDEAATALRALSAPVSDEMVEAALAAPRAVCGHLDLGDRKWIRAALEAAMAVRISK